MSNKPTVEMTKAKFEDCIVYGSFKAAVVANPNYDLLKNVLAEGGRGAHWITVYGTQQFISPVQKPKLNERHRSFEG